MNVDLSFLIAAAIALAFLSAIIALQLTAAGATRARIATILAELWLLIRDSLLFEDGEKLVLLGGVPADWLRGSEPITLTDMPTYYGPCSLKYQASGNAATLSLTGKANPPGGFVLRLPAAMKAQVKVDGKDLKPSGSSDHVLPSGTKQALIEFSSQP